MMNRRMIEMVGYGQWGMKSVTDHWIGGKSWPMDGD